MKIKLLDEGVISGAAKRIGAGSDPGVGAAFNASMIPGALTSLENIQRGGREVTDPDTGEKVRIKYTTTSDPKYKDKDFYNPYEKYQDIASVVGGAASVPMIATEAGSYIPKLKNRSERLTGILQKPFMAAIAAEQGLETLNNVQAALRAMGQKDYQKALEKTAGAMDPAASTAAAIASTAGSANPLVRQTFARSMLQGGGAGLYGTARKAAQGEDVDWLEDIGMPALDTIAGAGLKHLYTKEMAKQAVKSGLKKIPGLAWIPGLYFGGEQALKGVGEAMKGNWGRALTRGVLAGGEVASGLAGSVPGIGTVGGAAIDLVGGAGERYLEDTEEEEDKKKIKESIERKIRLNVLFEQVRERSSRDRDREGKATSPKGKERDREAIEAEREAATEAEREAATEVEKTPDIRLEPEIKSDAKPAEPKTEPVIITDREREREERAEREKAEREEREEREREEREKKEREEREREKKPKRSFLGTLGGLLGAMAASAGGGQGGNEPHLYSDSRDAEELGYAPHEILGSTSKVPVQVFHPNGTSSWITQKVSGGSNVINEAKLAPKESLQRKLKKQRYKVSYVQDGKKVEVFASSIRGVRRVVYGKKQYKVHNSTGSDVTGYFKKLLGE
jgi:hypothetical protein